MFNQNLSLVGIGSVSAFAPSAGLYSIEGKLELSNMSAGGGKSEVVVVVQIDSSTVYTGTAGALGFKIDSVCDAGDEIEITTSSAAAADQDVNAFKAVISISQGV